MRENCRNIAKIGRNFAGMTQERWAEALGFSVRTVAAWESGEQPLSSEAVIRMVDVTGQQVLSYWYLVDSLCAGASDLLPDVEVTALPQAVLSLMRRLRDFGRRERVDELINMAEDGRIDAGERNTYDDIMRELDNIIQAAMALRFAKEVP
ncbi:MAG: XRE family transcriptional regulator [Clostridia bacterium]|nr:XRE family transcriptional regulator [Clostridia bacterium]